MIFIHCLVFQAQPLTCWEDVEREISINFLVRTACVQLRASIPSSVSAGTPGCLGNTSFSQSPKIQTQSGLQKSYNSSHLAAPGNTKFMERAHHLLVILLTKIFRQPQDTHISLVPQHYRQHKYPYPNGNFRFPMASTWHGKRSSSSVSTEEHIRLWKLILSSILTPALRWGKHISHSVAKHLELFLSA